MPEKKRCRNGIVPVREYVRFHANQISDHPLRRKSSRIDFGFHTLDRNPSSPILPRFGHISYSKIPPISLRRRRVNAMQNQSHRTSVRGFEL